MSGETTVSERTFGKSLNAISNDDSDGGAKERQLYVPLYCICVLLLANTISFQANKTEVRGPSNSNPTLGSSNVPQKNRRCSLSPANDVYRPQQKRRKGVYFMPGEIKENSKD